jgi:hypothetical protein
MNKQQDYETEGYGNGCSEFARPVAKQGAITLRLLNQGASPVS